jgi:hypothetical protein
LEDVFVHITTRGMKAASEAHHERPK